MGLGRDLLQELLALKRSNALRGATRVVEIGAQQLSNDFLRSEEELKQLYAAFGHATVPYLGEPVAAGETAQMELQSDLAPTSKVFWDGLGLDYSAIDFDGHRHSYALDLNKDIVPADWRNRFDLVINTGTTEHIANQDNAFRVIHDLAHPYGIMIHNLPGGGMLTHGLITYTMKFFWHLARENGYEVLRLEMRPGGTDPFPGSIAATNRETGRGEPAPEFYQEPIRDWTILASLRKVGDRPFVTPLDLPPEVMPKPSQVRNTSPGTRTAKHVVRRIKTKLQRRIRGFLFDNEPLRTVTIRLPSDPVPPATAVEFLVPPLDSAKAQSLLDALSGEKTMAAFIDFVIKYLISRDHKSVFWGDRMLTLDKSVGFQEEPAFNAAFATIRGGHAYDQYASPSTIAWRLHTLIWAARIALSLPDGDFVECGVFKGDMAWMVGEVTGLAATGRQFHLYDSFEGFDPDQTSDADFPDLPGFLSFANKVYGEEGLWEGIERRFSGLPHYHLHKGYLPGTLDRDGFPDRIAYLHIDLNVAPAEIACLERLFDHVVPGGAIIFDDYGWKVYRRQKDAEDAFFLQRGYHIMELPTGQGLVIKR
jgi:hypothetical protein